MNEATLEAKVTAEIQKHFPSIARLKITHQEYLTLRVGHRVDIKAGGLEQAKATGRFDILISFEDKPLAILELKEPGRPLMNDDRDQGLSYAKLLNPQAPLVIVSNGETAEFYQTFNGEIWNPSNKDEEAIHSLFSHALSSAAREMEEAIRLLMGKQPYIWKALFRKYTEAALRQLTGKVNQYTHPLTTDFTIKRFLVSEIKKSITDGDTLLALVGPPLSGKTNVISQVCMANDVEDLVPIYIDAQDTSYGIFQHLANKLTREYYVKVEAAEIRYLICNGIQSMSGRLVIIIDGWTVATSGTLKEDVEELINSLHDDLKISILLCMDDTVFQEVMNTPGRPTYSAIGRKAKVIRLNPLDDNEFDSVCCLFFEKFQSVFHLGARYNLDYRIPRLLRLIANGLTQDANEAFVSEDCSKKYIPSVTSFLVFESWNRYISYPEIFGFFQDLARAYILDRHSRIDDPTLSLMSHGRGHIVRETAEKVIAYEKLNKMRAQGHIGVVSGPSGKVLILPKIPEFLAMAASYVIATKCVEIYRQDGFDDAYTFLIGQSDSFPYGDLVGARAIFEIWNKDNDLANDIIRRLIEDEPEESRLSESSRVLMYFEEVGKVNINFGRGTNEPIIGNIQPWNILSQIASYTIRLDQRSVDTQLRILERVGSYHRILLRPCPSSLRQNPGFHVHEMTEHGSVLCHKSGIIEPITFAMQCGFYHIPKDMLRLCLVAKKKNLFYLAHRLNIAALSVETCVERDVTKASKVAQKLLRPIIRGFLEKVCADTTQSKKKPRKNGRNEAYPYGSGKKYKK
jgi:hypothetical protein